MGHNPDNYAYRTSKRACAHFLESLAKDTFRLGIRVNVVSPGRNVSARANCPLTKSLRSSRNPHVVQIRGGQRKGDEQGLEGKGTRRHFGR